MNSPLNTMSNTIAKYIIIAFSKVNNPYSYHPYMFVTENYSSKFTIMFFWVPALKCPARNSIPKKSLYITIHHWHKKNIILNKIKFEKKRILMYKKDILMILP